MPTAESWLRAWQAAHGLPHYRPATAVPDFTQRVPRRIYQTSRNASHELLSRASWMSTWWQLNPEWSYHIFEDSDVEDFVLRFCSGRERAAFKRSLVGTRPPALTGDAPLCDQPSLLCLAQVLSGPTCSGSTCCVSWVGSTRTPIQS